MAKVLGSHSTPPVFDIKSYNPSATRPSYSFFRDCYAGVKRMESVKFSSMEDMATFMQFLYGLWEKSKEVNPSNKGSRVPAQHHINIDKLNTWDDEKAKIT